MWVALAKTLFPWETLEDSPSLKTIQAALKALPDSDFLAALRRYRGRGRDDYPVHVLWGVAVLTVLLRHTSTEATLAELRRNEALRRMIGLKSEHDVPRAWNVSRFLRVLGLPQHLELLQAMFDRMVHGLGQAVPQLGTHVAGDATDLSARPGRAEAPGAAELPQPSGGRKEYKDDAGKVVRIVEWFGYKLHLLVDTAAEVALAYHVTAPNKGDNEVLPMLVAQAVANLSPVSTPAPAPEATEPDDASAKLRRGPVFCRIKTLVYDMAADDEKVHEYLADFGIKPLIQNRSLWRDELERMLPGHDGRSNIVYDEAGTLYCYDKTTEPPVRQRMAYIGHEPSRGTIKYRCPARHGGWHCPSDARCNAGKSYGKTVRIKCELDLRRFPPIPRATKLFERLYKDRTAVERVNARLKLFWGADDGNVTGADRFQAHIGVVMLVHITLATLLARAPERKGTLGTMRLSTVAKALETRPRAARDG